MEGSQLEDADILRAFATSGARVLLIGRRAIVALGIPAVTSDYDVWVHIDDIEKLNAAFAALDYYPSCSPPEARTRGRYVLEDGEHIDVLISRSRTAPDGTFLDFEGAWGRRQSIDIGPGLSIFLPSIADLITTKLWGSRPKDLIDIEHLEALRQSKEREP